MVISHPLGRNFVSRLKAVDATVVPHDLPERDELDRLVQVRCGFPSTKRADLLINNNKFHVYSIYILQYITSVFPSSNFAKSKVDLGPYSFVPLCAKQNETE